MFSAGAPLWKPCGNCFVQILGGRNRRCDRSPSLAKVARKPLKVSGLFASTEEGLIDRAIGLLVPRFRHLHRFAAQGVRRSTALTADATHFTC